MALPIACGQISRRSSSPGCELLELRPADRVLEVGTGSAITLRCSPALRARLEHQCRPAVRGGGLHSSPPVSVRCWSATGRGLPEQALFDGICVTAASPARR
jgi:protein-L-isoaspartate O-methyltransferase